MKEGNNWWFTILIFFAGVASCYFCIQFHLLKINYELKVIDTTISLGTVIVGLYLGITINSRFSNKEHHINFIGPKIEDVWVKTAEINSLLTDNSKIDNKSISKKIKEANAAIAKLNNIFKTFQYNANCVDNLDTAIDELEKKLYSAPITNDIIDYTSIYADILKLLNTLEIRVVEAIDYLYKRK